MSVLFLPEVRFYFKELAQILFQENYFGIEENAIKYVEELFNDINTLLPVKPKRPAPEYFNIYGKDLYYATFKKNKRTQWHVFFNVYGKEGETIYLVRYISNNHVISQYL